MLPLCKLLPLLPLFFFTYYLSCVTFIAIYYTSKNIRTQKYSKERNWTQIMNAFIGEILIFSHSQPAETNEVSVFLIDCNTLRVML